MDTLWDYGSEQIYKALSGQVRLVGGCVRDFLLGKAPEDIDIVTSIPPKEVLKTSLI